MMTKLLFRINLLASLVSRHLIAFVSIIFFLLFMQCICILHLLCVRHFVNSNSFNVLRILSFQTSNCFIQFSVSEEFYVFETDKIYAIQFIELYFLNCIQGHLCYNQQSFTNNSCLNCFLSFQREISSSGTQLMSNNQRNGI